MGATEDLLREYRETADKLAAGIARAGEQLKTLRGEEWRTASHRLRVMREELAEVRQCIREIVGYLEGEGARETSC